MVLMWCGDGTGTLAVKFSPANEPSVHVRTYMCPARHEILEDSDKPYMIKFDHGVSKQCVLRAPIGACMQMCVCTACSDHLSMHACVHTCSSRSPPPAHVYVAGRYNFESLAKNARFIGHRNLCAEREIELVEGRSMQQFLLLPDGGELVSVGKDSNNSATP